MIADQFFVDVVVLRRVGLQHDEVGADGLRLVQRRADADTERLGLVRAGDDAAARTEPVGNTPSGLPRRLGCACCSTVAKQLLRSMCMIFGSSVLTPLPCRRPPPRGTLGFILRSPLMPALRRAFSGSAVWRQSAAALPANRLHAYFR
jgi:hypothetical protein